MLDKDQLILPGAVAAAATHLGKVRRTNQDRFCLRRLSDGSALISVADGLGGEPAGDIAATIVHKALQQLETMDADLPADRLVELATRLDRRVARVRDASEELGGMGTTLTLVWLRGEWAWWVHVGNSRLYLLRGQQLQQITSDHTLASFLVAEKEITTQQAESHYSKGVLDQYLGSGDCVPQAHRFRIADSDTLLLTSDGLYRLVPLEPMSAILKADASPAQKARTMVDRALAAGGNDNITAVVVDVSRVHRGAGKGDHDGK